MADQTQSFCALCENLRIPLCDVTGFVAGPDYSMPANLEISSSTRAVAWGLGYTLSSHETRPDFLFINPEAIQGMILWLQHGDASNQVLVLLHGGLGTPVAAQLQPYLP